MPYMHLKKIRCEICRKWFAPWKPESRLCSRICFWKHMSILRKTRNPMFNPASRLKMSRTLKRIGHKPKIQGGNGRTTPAPVKILHVVLGQAWRVEHCVRTKGVGISKVPNHYKIDLALPDAKLAIEVDGPSHYPLKRRHQDVKKDLVLSKLGWRVLRITNKEVMGDLEKVLKKVGRFITSK